MHIRLANSVPYLSPDSLVEISYTINHLAAVFGRDAFSDRGHLDSKREVGLQGVAPRPA